MSDRPQSLLVIDNVDFTTYIEVPTYQVNKNDVYTKWTDANHIEHRYLNRTKISGSFTFQFSDPGDFHKFLELIKEKTTTGRYVPNCLVYCVNVRQVELANLYFNFDPKEVTPFIGIKDYGGIEIEIEER